MVSTNLPDRVPPNTPGDPYLMALRTSYEHAQFTQKFGPTANSFEPRYGPYPHFHAGVDLVLPSTKAGTQADVRAPVSGEVIEAVDKWHDTTGFGEHIRIITGAGYKVTLGHFGAGSLRFHRGDMVHAGEVVAQQGNPTTGNSTGPHLHFQVQDTDSGQLVNPMPSTDWSRMVNNWKDLYYTAHHRLGFGAGFTTDQVLSPPEPGSLIYQRVSPNDTAVWGDRYGQTVVPFPSDPNNDPNSPPDPNGTPPDVYPPGVTPVSWLPGLPNIGDMATLGMNVGVFFVALALLVIGANAALKEKPVAAVVAPAVQTKNTVQKQGKRIGRVVAAVASKGKTETTGAGKVITEDDSKDSAPAEPKPGPKAERIKRAAKKKQTPKPKEPEVNE